MKTFIVLGMHRSATSLAAQGLCKSGVCMGKRMLGPHASNPYGHWEDVDFIHLNDMILNRAGGSWDNPPGEKAISYVGAEIGPSIKEFIETKEREPFWGWKDPRTTLTIKCYMPHLTNPHFIVCYRNPLEVAESLNKRDNMAINDGIMLARIYNHRLSAFLQEFTEC